MNVLVTDGDQRAALAIVRSLGKRGINLIVGEEKSPCLASKSRYCKKSVIYPSPYKYPAEFFKVILRFIKEYDINVLFPVTDVTTYLIAQKKKELEEFTKIPLPSFENYTYVSNKYEILKHTIKEKLPVPTTYFIENQDILAKYIDKITYPAVAKPFSSKILTEKGWISTKVHIVRKKEELLSLYKNEEYFIYPSLVQEYINGYGTGIFVLMDHGELIIAFAHKRLREKPPSGGVSVLRESIPVNPLLKEYAIKLLNPIGWHGVAMLEFKVDEKTGQHYLMEINGRLWGSLQLSIDAGVDFPYLLYQIATGGPVETKSDYKTGIKSRWFLGDLDHTILRVFKKDSYLNLSEEFPSRLRTLLQFLKFYEPDMYYEVLSLNDPFPFLYELSQFIYTRSLSILGKSDA